MAEISRRIKINIYIEKGLQMIAKTTLFFLGVTIPGMVALGATSIHAQQPTPKRPAYYISEFELTDPEGIRPYSARVESTFAPFSGRYIVRGGNPTSLEGEAPKRFVVIEFDSVEQAQAWYNSAAYAEIKPIRHNSAKSRVFILEGTPN
jgi:uncharacterized protein (DUF1330 family)